MPRRIVLLLIIAHGSCMEMRETVERTVMVRRTGSDLQPAATGYIYKKGSDGEAVVTKMGETEVMEQLSKLYEQPKSFAAPIPISSPFAEDNTKAALKAKDHVIPVKENSEDAVDGIADDDYRKLFDEYASTFDDYLKSLGGFKSGENDDFGKQYGYDVHHDYNPKKDYSYGKQGAGDYDNKKFESYYLSKKHDKPYDSDVYGKLYKHQEYNHDNNDKGFGSYKGHKDEGNTFQYKKVDEKDYNKDAIKDSYKYSDEPKYYGHAGSGDGHAYGSEHHDALGAEGTEHDNTSENSEEDSTTNGYGDFPTKSGLAASKSFSYEVKH
ncbi:unnamed protein product [Colias eurytheme]|nr:unnamed protein product [Colias eurytheme]